jgi:hypothetical protein
LWFRRGGGWGVTRKKEFSRLMKQRHSFIKLLSYHGGDPVLSGETMETMVIKLRKPGHDYEISRRILSQVFGKNNFSATAEFHRFSGEYYFSSIIINVNRAKFISSVTDYFIECP